MPKNISEYEAERWRQMSDELTGQSIRLDQLAKTREDWEAVEWIRSAAAYLFSAFAGVMKDHHNQENN